MRKIKLQRTDGLPNFFNYRYLLENQYVFFQKTKWMVQLAKVD